VTRDVFDVWETDPIFYDTLSFERGTLFPNDRFDVVAFFKLPPA